MKKIIIGNWKMNPTSLKEAESLFKDIAKLSKNYKGDVAICPPFPFINNLRKLSKKVLVGAQNVHLEVEGAYTGEVSSKMLRSVGATFCVVGHSERRAMGETNEMISKKMNLLLKDKITPILCVGESERTLDHSYLSFVRVQLVEAISNIPKSQLKNLVVAYEPVWAIGKNALREATPEECMEMVLYIRKTIADLSDSKIAHCVRIVYGGSVHPENASSFIHAGGADGFLVGRDSLNAKKFIKIIESCNQ